LEVNQYEILDNAGQGEVGECPVLKELKHCSSYNHKYGSKGLASMTPFHYFQAIRTGWRE
jgi:hypothetical protein